MASFERHHVGTLLGRLRESPRRLILIAGPRQVGKTTVIEQTKEKLDRDLLLVRVDEPGSRYLPTAATALDTAATSPVPREPDTRWLADLWERARMDADRSERGYVLALDEIQKVPNWSEAVKGLWDADRYEQRRLHVILSGSAWSDRELARTLRAHSTQALVLHRNVRSIRPRRG